MLQIGVEMGFILENWDALVLFGFLAYGGLLALLVINDRIDPVLRTLRWVIVFSALMALGRAVVLVSAVLGLSAWLAALGGLMTLGALLVPIGVAARHIFGKSLRLGLFVALMFFVTLGASALMPRELAAFWSLGVFLAASGASAGLSVCHFGPWRAHQPRAARYAAISLALLVAVESLALSYPWALGVLGDPEHPSVVITLVSLIVALPLSVVVAMLFRVRLAAVRKTLVGDVEHARCVRWDLLFSGVLVAAAFWGVLVSRYAGENEEDKSRKMGSLIVSVAADLLQLTGHGSATDGLERMQSSIPDLSGSSQGPGSGAPICFFHVASNGLGANSTQRVIDSRKCLSQRRATALMRLFDGPFGLFSRTSPTSVVPTQPFGECASVFAFTSMQSGSSEAGESLWLGVALPGGTALGRVVTAKAVPLAAAGAFAVILLLVWVGMILSLVDSARIRKTQEALSLEQAASQEALRRSEERFRIMSQSAQEAIVVVSQQGAIQFWNPAAERILGWASHEVVGSDFNQLLAPESLEAEPGPGLDFDIQTSAARKPAGPVEIVARCKDASVVALELTITVVEASGAIQNLAVARDISERVRQRERLDDYQRKLELANVQLAESIKEARKLAERADAANDAKSQFLANMSHEVRTPLNGVMGASSLLAQTQLTPDQRDYLSIIRRSSEALLAIINDLLDFSRIEAGRVDLEEVDFSPHALVEDIVEVMALRAQEKGLDVTAHSEPYVPERLCGDPARFRQILVNLVGNAIKFTKRGEVSVVVSATPHGADRFDVSVEIRDTGIGIASDRLEQIFQPFTQLEASDTRNSGGMGVGLSISRRLAEQMGGSITVSSEPGKGSTFAVTVPLKAAVTTPRKAAPWRELSGLRVLVLDAHETSRRLLGALLEQWGCLHQEEATVEAALIAMREANNRYLPFEVVIVDANSEAGAVERLAAWVKDSNSTGTTRLLLMTALGRRGDVQRLKDLGYAAYITKPVKRGQLHEVLNLISHGVPSDGGNEDLITRFVAQEVGRQRLGVLVVDDSEVNRQVALGMLESLGWRGEAVASAPEALAALANQRYELVLMDVQMPEMDGRTATRMIREGRRGVKDPTVPVVAVTAHASQLEEDACLAAGMDEFITKPIELKRLAKVLSRWHEVLRNDHREPRDFEDTSELSPAKGPPLFDRAALLERLGGDDSLVEGIIQVFRDSMPPLVLSLQEALEEGNLVKASRQAHQLKGAAGNVGAMALHKVTHQLEKWASQGDPQRAVSSFERLKSEFERFLQHVA